MSLFQIIVTGIFAVLILVGVGVFALFGGIGGKSAMGQVVIWGTVDQGTVDAVLADLSQQDKSISDITYVAKKPASYESELINAIAAGQGPDLFFITPATIGTLGNKAGLMPYDVMSQGDFINAYVDEGQLFLTPQGILAMPFSIDPLVMYWNRDLFAAAGQGVPPQYWEDLLSLAPRLTSLDAGSNIRKSATALGSWDNVQNAKAILSALMMQAGEYLTARNAAGALVPILGNKTQNDSPAAQALSFYTSFANPSKANYSWNRSLDNSYDAFVAGDLAMYFGFAGEYRSIAERNPNLRFGVATLPQLKGSAGAVTSGNIVGLAVARGARNPSGAPSAALKLSTASAAASVAQHTGLPPVRRDVQVNTSASAAAATFVQAGLTARSWADPNSAATDTVFKTMIESVLSGRGTSEQAVFEAAQAFRQLLPNK
jgi:multiple sugar transport system substrate-binding protein